MSILPVARATCISTILASLIEQCRSPGASRFRDDTCQRYHGNAAVAQANVISCVAVEYADGSRLTAKRSVAKRVEVMEGTFQRTSMRRGVTFCPDSSFPFLFRAWSHGSLMRLLRSPA